MVPHESGANRLSASTPVASTPAPVCRMLQVGTDYQRQHVLERTFTVRADQVELWKRSAPGREHRLQVWTHVCVCVLCEFLRGFLQMQGVEAHTMYRPSHNL